MYRYSLSGCFSPRWYVQVQSQWVFYSSLVCTGTVSVGVLFLAGMYRYSLSGCFIPRWYVQVQSQWVFYSSLVCTGTVSVGVLFLTGMYRYSLPVNFQAVVMKPNKKAQKKLTETLNQLYGHLDSRFIESEAEVGGACCLGNYTPWAHTYNNLDRLHSASCIR